MEWGRILEAELSKPFRSCNSSGYVEVDERRADAWTNYGRKIGSMTYQICLRMANRWSRYHPRSFASEQVLPLRVLLRFVFCPVVCHQMSSSNDAWTAWQGSICIWLHCTGVHLCKLYVNILQAHLWVCDWPRHGRVNLPVPATSWPSIQYEYVLNLHDSCLLLEFNCVVLIGEVFQDLIIYVKESRTFNATFVGWPGYLTNSIFSLHLLPCADERGDTRSRTSSRDAPSDEVPPFLRNSVPWSQVKSSNISINDSSRSLYSFLGARNWTLNWLTKGCKWMWLLIALTYCPSAFSRF